MKLKSLLQAFKKSWLALGRTINLLISTVILTLLWITLIGIYALVFKIVRVFRRPEREETYWITVDSSLAGTMRQQF